MGDSPPGCFFLKKRSMDAAVGSGFVEGNGDSGPQTATGDVAVPPGNKETAGPEAEAPAAEAAAAPAEDGGSAGEEDGPEGDGVEAEDNEGQQAGDAEEGLPPPVRPAVAGEPSSTTAEEAAGGSVGVGVEGLAADCAAKAAGDAPESPDASPEGLGPEEAVHGSPLPHMLPRHIA